MVWISICGTKEEAEEYEYEIKIDNSSKKRARQKYLFTGKRGCVSCDMSCDEMMEKGSALFLNKDMLESAAMEMSDGEYLRFAYTLLIKKK